MATVNPIDLYELRYNNQSQDGEDGIIEKLIELEGIDKGFFCEFGAWDGRYLSNCYNLIKKGWSGCFIEGDSLRYKNLLKNVPQSEIIKINAWVTAAGENSLDNLLQRHKVSYVDLLSIDIDGDDLLVWKGVKKFVPKIVIVEYNPTIPSDVLYVNPPGCNHGNSMLAVLDYARSAGYSLIEGTDTNLMFVRSESRTVELIEKKNLADIAQQTKHKRYFFAYDGTLLVHTRLSGPRVLEILLVPWSYPPVIFPQPIPKMLRGYAPNKTKGLSRFFFSILTTVLLRPIAFFRTISVYLKAYRNRGKV